MSAEITPSRARRVLAVLDLLDAIEANPEHALIWNMAVGVKGQNTAQRRASLALIAAGYRLPVPTGSEPQTPTEGDPA